MLTQSRSTLVSSGSSFSSSTLVLSSLPTISQSSSAFFAKRDFLNPLFIGFRT